MSANELSLEFSKLRFLGLTSCDSPQSPCCHGREKSSNNKAKAGRHEAEEVDGFSSFSCLKSIPLKSLHDVILAKVLGSLEYCVAAKAMTESEKIMNTKEFRRSTSPAAASSSRTGGKDNSDSFGKHSDSQKKKSQLKQPSVIGKPNAKKDDKPDAKSFEERCERAKLLREKQIEDRKKKSEERKTAIEERRRQKEEDVTKNDVLRNLVGHKGHQASRGVGTGRKLPNLPANGCFPRRLSSGSSSGDSPSHTPPGSSKGTKTSRRDLTGPSSLSTSCLSNVGNGQVQHRAKSNMSKKTSASTSNLMDHTLSTKPASKVKEKSLISNTLRESRLPKAQSTGAIHQVGSTKHHTSRPSTGKKTKSKSAVVQHAGMDNPEDAKKALAEHRRKIREEAERKALLDKEKQEELRKQREEEEKRLAEENGKNRVL